MPQLPSPRSQVPGGIPSPILVSKLRACLPIPPCPLSSVVPSLKGLWANWTCRHWDPKGAPSSLTLVPLLRAFYFLIDKPSQPETSLSGSLGISAPPDSDPDPRALLSARQREYKLAALNAKRAGDLNRARELMRIGKVWHLTRRPCVQPLVSQMGAVTCMVIHVDWA